MRKPLYYLLALALLSASCSKTEVGEITYSTSDWMSQIISANSSKEFALIDIALPSSHDAGTYILTGCMPAAANACNTQTQSLNMKAQLESGIRIFDIRPVLLEGKYYTQHVTECNGLGCRGDLIENMLQETKSFLDAHTELVILKLGNFCGTGASDSVFTGMLSNVLGDKIYKEPEGETSPFINRPLKNMISSGGKVLVIYNGTLQDTPENRTNGMFTGSVLPTKSKWSNTPAFDVLKADQLELFSNFDNNGTELFELSWAMTQDILLAFNCAIGNSDTISIRNLAEQSNGELKSTIDTLIENGTIRKGKIPNIISVDFADKFVTEECIRLSNLNVN